ncbi:hypothetical protein [Thermococcus sp.]|uniref:hypothetical protein n=1 Tax=Thermococcus sp. TaxID=35749 RepID=UPI002604D0AB|nr:hypothetical protein [Thermococcus sp.]
MAVRSEEITSIFLKLVDADVEIVPSEDGTVHVDAEPGNAFTVKRDGAILEVLTSTSWKLRNLLEKEKERAKLTLRVPRDVKVGGGMKRASLKARKILFDSLSIGEATAELEECEVKSLAVAPARVKGSLYVTEGTKVAVSMGSLELRVLEFEGDLDLSTVMGSIVLKLPEDCDAVIETVQQGGEVVVNSGRLLGSGEHRIRISNVRGTVIVDLWGEGDEV